MLVPQAGEFSVLRFAEQPAAVLLLDPAADRLYLRFRPSVEHEDADLYEMLGEQIEREAAETGAGRLLDFFEDTLSNAIAIDDRRAVPVREFHAALDRLYEEHVLGVRPIRASGPIPLYSLRAAAGRFGEDMAVEAEAFIAVPAHMRGSRDLYAAHIVGHSMEPDIPDGSVAVFRYAPAGSRQAKKVLVWRRAASAEGGEFTLKLYESEKTVTEEGWQHTRIRLKPLNPDYPVLELEDDSEYRVLGELVGVVAIDEL